MSAFPTLSDIEAKWRASGSGVCVIVEGETEQEDPWFYNTWFGDRAREVTFFPQDGWEQVVAAVASLRASLGAQKVYGIIDRDFRAELDVDFAAQGILRTPRYTLENYLLDPHCWAQVFAFIFRRQENAPDGWDDPARVQGYIEQSFRNCLVLAAHNQVIQFGNESYPRQAAQTRKTERTYREHPDALANVDPVVKLRAWGQQLGAAEDLGGRFEEALRFLEGADLEGWEHQVSGKYALLELHRRFPRLPGAGQFPLSHYLNEYLRACPDPPLDLTELIDRIIEDAGR